MTDADTIAHYSACASKPESWQRADWGSAEGQRARLNVIAEELAHRTARGATVLDVGCGDGTLGTMLSEDLLYTGWDVVPELVARGQAHGLDVEQRDLMTPTTATWDWVVASGLFTYRGDAWVMAAIRRMWDLCREGVIVNLLSTCGREQIAGEYQVHPANAVYLASIGSMKYSLRHDYWPGDMTLVLCR